MMTGVGSEKNARRVLVAWVAATALGPLAACNGKLDTTADGSRSANEAGAMGVTSSSTGGSSSGGGSAAEPGPSSGSSGGASSSGVAEGVPDSSADGAWTGGPVGIDAGVTLVDGGAAHGQDAATGYDAAPGCGSAAVSFQADIVPIFQSSCTLSSVCHGQMNNSTEEGLYLGENEGATSASAVYAMLVGVRSMQDPSMNLVTPGDSSRSYLWHKVYGDQDTLANECTQATTMCVDCTASTPCGDLMPYLGEPLPFADLCAIEGWIGRGAPNN
jgi:hypothetical protein